MQLTPSERVIALSACHHLQRAALTILGVLRGELGARMLGDLEGEVTEAIDALSRGGWLSGDPKAVAERNVAALLAGAKTLFDALDQEVDVVDGSDGPSPNDAMRYATAGDDLWQAMRNAGSDIDVGKL